MVIFLLKIFIDEAVGLHMQCWVAQWQQLIECLFIILNYDDMLYI